MTDPDVSLEVAGIVGWFAGTGIPGRVTSTWRPGAVTAAGRPSRHGAKLAVDLAAPIPGRDTVDLAAIFRAFLPVERHLAELIYGGPQVDFSIRAGRRVGKIDPALHRDHVHVAVDRGVILGLAAGPGRPRRLPDDYEGEAMTEPVDAMEAPGGGVWVLTKDGGVRAYRGAPFLGSYPGLPEAGRQGGPRTFVTIEGNGRGGYDLVSSGYERYSFPT